MQSKNSPSTLRPRFYLPSRLALVSLALGATVAFTPLPAARAADDPQGSTQTAADSNSYRLFYDKLADDGDWFQTDEYGYVFQPRVATQDKTWHPYTDGYWARTDAGWTWVSNEDFGWACYHYGRWANLVDTGWVWIPGADWSPAYVSWRVSKDHKHVGWAPLPPEAQVTKGAAIEGWVDSAYDVGPDAYTFIDTDQFGDNSYRSHILPSDQNVTIFSDTENVTRVDYRTVGSQSVLYDGGPDVATIRESSGHPVRELRLETRPENVEYFERGDRRKFSEVNGNQFVVATAAPDVITSTSIRVSQPARVNRRLNNFTVDRGYRGIRDPQQVDRIRASVRSQSPRPPEQVERAASAAMHRNSPDASSERHAPIPSNERSAPVPPNERNGQSDRQRSATGTSRNEPNPAATGAPTPGRSTPVRDREQTKPEATPGHTATETPAPRSSTPPEGGESDRQHGRTTPETTPAARAASSPEANKETRADKRPESAPTPREKSERENQTERNVSPKPEASTSATPHRAPERPERTDSKPAEPEANRNRTEELATPRHEEKPRSNEAEENKPAAAKPESQPESRRNPEEGREKAAENSGRKRSEKKEAPTAPSVEKEKSSPKP